MNEDKDRLVMVHTLHEIHDHVELLRVLEGVVETDDERMTHIRQDVALGLGALDLHRR